ncbi:indoleamine 2,3-dioxygenase beta type [Neurospora hispaniola]|uniref:Indoleamine 2,3-dioxygenase beta type n=1 Tax=Neurospora hispaniola TaxID=588809 RepID=A0AAJ0I987_9PEZI|nr:indoleamine 2,3-dioxygenase beta type [Neurospora hispaniola]
MSPFEHLPTSATGTVSKQQASSTESDESNSSFPDHIQSLLIKYDVTTNGFLPEGPPLELLPDEYYAPWEDLIKRLPETLDAGTFRAEVDRLPVLQTDRLIKEEEWRRAYVVLCFFAHGYIWGGRRPSEILPEPISVPLLSVSKHLDLPPIATYASLNLWNFRCVPPPSSSFPSSPPAIPASFSSSPPSLTTCSAAKAPKVFDPTDLSRLQTLHTFTGTSSESWFYLVSVAMEAQGAYIIPIMLRALQAIGLRSETWKESTTKALRELVHCVQAVGELLERMYEGCEAMVFYHRIRPYLAGSKGMHAGGLGLGRGVFYDLGPFSPAGFEKTGEKGEEGEEVEEVVQGQKRKGKWMAYRGGSNGQSSLIQFWDLVLGVEHVSAGHSSPHSSGASDSAHSDTKEKEKPFHDEVREYMPLKHRQFLSLVSKMGLGKGGIRKAVMEMVEAAEHEGRELDEKERELQGAFTDATRALAGFRNKHLQIVARYIVIPSRQAVPEGMKRPGVSLVDGEVGANEGQVVNLATASSGLSQGSDDKKNEGPELTGTGGTALLPFLKQTRDETLKAGEVGK